jgi:hypothetical protein
MISVPVTLPETEKLSNEYGERMLPVLVHRIVPVCGT